MLFALSWLAEVFPDHKGIISDELFIKEVTTDSRETTNQGLFIPLIGERFDGHYHIDQAIKHGAIAIIWGKEKRLPDHIPDDFPVFYVQDTLDALQEVAMVYREKINPIVVGITGSNGKTTTKDILASILSTTYKTHATKGNFNNHIGLPLTILAMPLETDVLVLEMGMNHFKEIERLSAIAKPDYAIITNIGESHIEYLGSRKGIATAKLEIMHGLKENGMLIIDGDEDLLSFIHEKKNVITCGFNETNMQVIKHVEISHNQTSFKLGDTTYYFLPLLGKHNAQNASYAIALAKKLNITDQMINKGLQALELTSMRLEMLKGKAGVSIINDAYNASPTSMKAAINVVKQIDGFKEKVLILGDMFELGEQSDRLHESMATEIVSPITAVFTHGQAAKRISDSIDQKQSTIISQHFDTKEQLEQALQKYIHSKTLLLFKASRGMKFETIIEDLLET